MVNLLPDRFDQDAPVFPVSIAASLADMHPQTLRGYDRLGLVVPSRARGMGRRYSLRDVARLRHIQYLSQEEGVNLEGIRRILKLEEELENTKEQLARVYQIVEQLQNDERVSRLFTSSANGVHLGRMRHSPLELTTDTKQRID